MERHSWYILRRLLVLVIGILVILTVEFWLFRVAPDDPLRWALPYPTDVPIDPSSMYGEWAEEVTEMLGEPLYVQYFVFIGDMLTGDFGFSYMIHAEISDYIYSAMWKTLVLFGTSLSLCLVIGSLAGRAISKVRRYLTRQTLSVASLALFSVPVLAWQWFFLRYVSYEWGLLPSGPVVSTGSSGTDLDHLIMPLASVFLASIGAFILCARDGQTRVSAAASQERMTLRDSLFAAMPNLQFMIAASVIFVVSAEIMFAYPGLGWYFVSSLWNLDYFMLQATFFLLAAMIFLANFALETVVTLVRPERRLDLFLREDDDQPDIAYQEGMQANPPPFSFGRIGGAITRVAKDYLRSPIGVVSLAVFIAIAVLAAVGRWPSSDQAYLFHDESSMDLFLNGATALVVISVVAGLLASVIGIALGIAMRYGRPYIDGILTGIAQGLIAIPFLAMILFRWAWRWQDFGYLEAALWCSIPVAALVALLSFHGFISARKRVAAASRQASKSVKLIHSLPSVTSWALAGLKYGMPITVITVFVCDFYRLTGYGSWGYAFEEGVRAETWLGYQTVQWDYILLPLIGTALLIGSMFLILDTVERIIRKRFSWLV